MVNKAIKSLKHNFKIESLVVEMEVNSLSLEEAEICRI